MEQKSVSSRENIPDTKKDIPKIIIAVILTALIAGGSVYLWQRSNNQTAEDQATRQAMDNQIANLQSQLEQLKKEQASSKNDAAIKDNDNVIPSASPTSNTKVYTNDIYKYQITLPLIAQVEEAPKNAFGLSPEETEQGLTFDAVYKKYTGKICLNINLQYGYVTISAPENKNFSHVMCGRTGVGIYDQNIKKEEEIEVMGKKYTAKGNEFVTGKGLTTEEHNETFVLELQDGTRLEFGTSLPDNLDEKVPYDNYLKIRKDLIDIIESYKNL